MSVSKTKRPSAGPPTSERQLCRDLGLSRAKMWRAKRVAAIPEAEFETMIESDDPPTVTQLVAHARGVSATPAKAVSWDRLVTAWNTATDAERERFAAEVLNTEAR